MYKRTLKLTISLFITLGFISSCSQNTPNLTTGQNNNSTTKNNTGSQPNNTNSTTTANTQSTYSANSPEQSAETQDILANDQDDEKTIRDTDSITNSSDNFTVKAKKDEDEDKNEKNKLKSFENREKSLMEKIKRFELQLKNLRELTREKLDRLERKDVTVRTSDTVEIQNADGTKTVITSITFQNKTDNIIRESKVSKTYLNGVLIEVEYYLTVTTNNFVRTYLKLVDFNSDGSKTITIKSETKWKNGKTRTVNELLNIDANGNGSGTGTVLIIMPDGKTITFTFNITIRGHIIIKPSPTPLPTPTPVPTPVPTPTPITLKGILTGTITIGPLCSVEPCHFNADQIRDFYNSRKILVYNEARTRIVAEFSADINGNYRIELDAGVYIVDRVRSNLENSNLPQKVTIYSGATTILNITIDTGIR